MSKEITTEQELIKKAQELLISLNGFSLNDAKYIAEELSRLIVRNSQVCSKNL